MSNIDTSKWKEFVIGELFDIHPTKAYKLTNSSLYTEDGKNPVVVNSSFNNGIGGYSRLENTENGNIVTFSDTTSADAIFYQKNPFIGYPHIQGMYPIGEYKNKWNEKSYLFFISVFRSRAIGLNFDYVNKFTREDAKKMTIKLPVDINGNPNFAYMEEYMQNLESAVSSSLTALRSAKSSKTCEKIDIQKWKQFRVEDIFPEIIKPEVYHTRQLIQDDNGIPYVVRSKFNNGIKYRVKKPVGKINPPNVISFGAENATFFYQQEEWVSGRDMYYIEVGDLPFYTCCFLTSIFQILAKKYSYNNGLFPDKLKKEKIMLPINNENGEIDYTYMEEFMKKKFFECKECLTSIVAV